MIHRKLRPLFRCNHSCVDKAKCRHLWYVLFNLLDGTGKHVSCSCRDGLLEPPRLPKKLNAAESIPMASTSHNATRVKPKSTKYIKPRPDRTLEELESLNQRNNSLKLPEGQRLKLNSPEEIKGKRKRRPVPNFDIELADITNGDCHGAATSRAANLDNSDDDLPEPFELLKASTETPSSQSRGDYSNSELEALIRAVPMVDGQQESVVGVKYRTLPAHRDSPWSIESSPTTSVEQHASHPTKRLRLDTLSVTQNTSPLFTCVGLGCFVFMCTHSYHLCHRISQNARRQSNGIRYS